MTNSGENPRFPGIPSFPVAAQPVARYFLQNREALIRAEQSKYAENPDMDKINDDKQRFLINGFDLNRFDEMFGSSVIITRVDSRSPKQGFIHEFRQYFMAKEPIEIQKPLFNATCNSILNVRSQRLNQFNPNPKEFTALVLKLKHDNCNFHNFGPSRKAFLFEKLQPILTEFVRFKLS